MKIVALYSAYSRNSYSDTALRVIVDTVRVHYPETSIISYILPNMISRLSTLESLNQPRPIISKIGNDLFSSDLVLIGSPIYNFTYSPYLHVLFHELRDRLLTFDSNGKVIGRNLQGKFVFLSLTGRSSRFRWWTLTRYFVAWQFNFLLRFWGGRSLGCHFVPDCHPDMFEQRREKIMEEMGHVAEKLILRTQHAIMKCNNFGESTR